MGKLVRYLKTNMDLWMLLPLEKCLSCIKPENKQFIEFVDEISKIDSIENYEEFSARIQPILGGKKMTENINYGAEASFYGYYDSLFEYAGLEKTRQVLIPSFEHGVRFGEAKWKYKFNSISYACQGPKRVHEIHDVDPMKPVFVLGPYIHYASSYYTEEKLQELKENYGRTLLVFPSHTCEDNQATRNENSFVEIVKNKYMSDYDTLLVCMYWNDVNDPVVEAFEKIGAKFVSAGFRGDTNFIRRLKTLLYLADDVVVNDIGTNIGFAKYMGCNVYLEVNKQVNSDEVFMQNLSTFKRAFSSNNKEFTEEQKQEQQILYDEYWGGEKFLLTPMEIKNILNALQLVCKKSGYSVAKIPKIIMQMIEESKISDEPDKRKNGELFARAIRI